MPRQKSKSRIQKSEVKEMNMQASSRVQEGDAQVSIVFEPSDSVPSEDILEESVRGPYIFAVSATRQTLSEFVCALLAQETKEDEVRFDFRLREHVIRHTLEKSVIHTDTQYTHVDTYAHTYYKYTHTHTIICTHTQRVSRIHSHMHMHIYTCQSNIIAGLSRRLARLVN